MVFLHWSQRDQAVANVELSKISLAYTQVLAPFDGQMDRHLVDPGNVGGAGTPTKLASIEQVDPAYVYFSVNEGDLLRIRSTAMKNVDTARVKPPELLVDLGLQRKTVTRIKAR